MIYTEAQTLDDALHILVNQKPLRYMNGVKIRSQVGNRNKNRVEKELYPQPKSKITLPKLKWMGEK